MRKLSNILDESVWGGMLDRSTGDSIRKEDDVNLLDRDGLYDYLKNHYKNLNSFVGIANISPLDRIGVPILIKGGGYYVTLDFSTNEVFVDYAMPYLVRGFFSILADQYSLRSDSDKKPTKYIISPKDGSEVTNSFFIEVIDFITDNIPDSFERGVKKIVEESVWGGMLDRSTGDTIRKEDDVNLLDFDGFYEYLQGHYVCTGISSFFHTNSIMIIPLTYIDICGEDTPASIIYAKRNVDIVVSIIPGIQYKKEDLFKKLQDNFSVDVIEQDKSLYPDEKEWESKIMNKIKPKDGSEVTNKFVVEVLDFIIDNIDNPKDLEIERNEKVK